MEHFCIIQTASSSRRSMTVVIVMVLSKCDTLAERDNNKINRNVGYFLHARINKAVIDRRSRVC